MAYQTNHVYTLKDWQPDQVSDEKWIYQKMKQISNLFIKSLIWHFCEHHR